MISGGSLAGSVRQMVDPGIPAGPGGTGSRRDEKYTPPSLSHRSLPSSFGETTIAGDEVERLQCSQDPRAPQRRPRSPQRQRVQHLWAAPDDARHRLGHSEGAGDRLGDDW